jgi:hypothetical protein
MKNKAASDDLARAVKKMWIQKTGFGIRNSEDTRPVLNLPNN